MNVISPLQVELFVNDLEASIDFYGRILGFTMGEQQSDGYTPMHNGPVTFAINVNSALSDDHPIYIAESDRPGRGVEFVLRVEDLRKLYAHVQAQGWPISGKLHHQPWGLDDFRLQDPDGYYLRITTQA